VNAVIDKINRAVEFTINLPFGASFSVNPPDIPHVALGGVFAGSAAGTLIRIAEGNKAEAVVPLERPARAAAVLREAGLLPAVAAGNATAANTTLVHIDQATFVEPVDLQSLLAVVTTAYAVRRP
jgi:hypothetical protein